AHFVPKLNFCQSLFLLDYLSIIKLED
ncbi:uncharacterized protein METZ01_LOCUS384416, partial [marine metagenome]